MKTPQLVSLGIFKSAADSRDAETPPGS